MHRNIFTDDDGEIVRRGRPFIKMHGLRNDFVIVGGFTDENPIPQHATGLIATFHFRIREAFGHTDLEIIRPVDDMVGQGWTARPGSLYPCPPEVCDGVDNDCDGEVDEDCIEYFFDGDNDEFGDPNNRIWTIYETEPEGFITFGCDCDDTDPSINPDADESCDGKDNN